MNKKIRIRIGLIILLLEIIILIFLKTNNNINNNIDIDNININEKNNPINKEQEISLKKEIEKLNFIKNNFKNSNSNFYREGDDIKINTEITNNTDKETSFKVIFKSNDMEVNTPEKFIVIGANSKNTVSFWSKSVINKYNDIKYNIEILGNDNNKEIIEKTIEYKEFPNNKLVLSKSGIAKKDIVQHFKIDIPENTNMKRSNINISFSNKTDENIKNNPYSNFAFSIGYIQNRDKRFSVGGNYDSILERKFSLYDIMQYKENIIELTTYIISGADLFNNLTVNIYPENKLKIKAISNGIKIDKEIYKINSEKNIIDFDTIYYSKDNTELATPSINKLEKILNNKYEIGENYKVGIKLSFSKDSIDNISNIILEDYIPSSFEILEYKFKSNSLYKNNNWENIKYFEDKVSSNIKTNGKQDLYFEYIITPKFKGNFIFPPAVVHLEKDPKINAQSKFNQIQIK